MNNLKYMKVRWCAPRISPEHIFPIIMDSRPVASLCSAIKIANPDNVMLGRALYDLDDPELRTCLVCKNCARVRAKLLRKFEEYNV